MYHAFSGCQFSPVGKYRYSFAITMSLAAFLFLSDTDGMSGSEGGEGIGFTLQVSWARETQVI